MGRGLTKESRALGTGHWGTPKNGGFFDKPDYSKGCSVDYKIWTVSNATEGPSVRGGGRPKTKITRSGPKEASAAIEGVLRNFAHFGEMITSWEKIISCEIM